MPRAANPDRLLKRFCRTGDPAALGALFDRTAAELLRVAVWLCGNRNDAEDLLQRTFVSVIESRASFDPRRGALPWLCGILGNHARRLQEQRGRRLPEVREHASERDPAEVAADAELVAAVAKLKGELGPPYREVLELHLGQGLNAKEIAQRLGRPAGTVRTQLVRGLELLRRRLPSGFVAGCAPVLLPDALQLAGVKAAVMAAADAAASVVAAVALTSGGVLMGKKIVAVASALALLLGLAVYLNWPRASAADQPQSAPVTARLDPLRKDNVAGAAVEVPVREPVAVPVPEEVDPGFATVRVVVHWDHDGSPAAGIGVHVQRIGSSRLFRRDALTDAAGTATLRHVAPGSTYVASSHGDLARIDVTADGHPTVELTAHQSGMARGQVVDDEGRPVAAARIWVSDSGGDASGHECTESDAAGRFTVLLRGDHCLGARKAGYAPSLARNLTGRQAREGDIVLTLRGAGGRVHGTVRNARGAPVAWASVLVGSPNAPVVPGSTFEKMECEAIGDQLVTDRDGHFAVEGVRLGNVPVHAWAAGHAPWRGQALVALGAASEVQVTLADAAAVAGTVRDATGHPVAEAWVGFGGSRDFATSHSRSDAEGRFRLDDLPVGNVAVEAGKGEVRAATTLALQPATTAEWNPVLGHGQRITGRVLGPDGQPLAAGVGFVLISAAPPSHWHETAADGSFELTNVGDAPVEVQVQQHEVVLQRLPGVVPGTHDLVIRLGERDLPTAKLRGRVVDEQGVALRASVYAWRDRSRTNAADTDVATGAFVLGPVPAGGHEVVVMVQGRGDWRSDCIELEPRADVDLGDIVVRRPGRIEFTLHDGAGQPVPQTLVTVKTPTGQQAGVARFERGKAVVELVQPGRLFVGDAATRDLAVMAQFEVRSGETTTVALVARPAAKVEIRIQDPDAIAGLSVSVRVLTTDGAPAAFLQVRGQPAIYPNILPGTYELECQASDGRKARGRIVVRSVDERPSVTLELPRR